MKLTKRWQGRRARRSGWPAGYFVDLKFVGRGEVKECHGITSDGKRVAFATSERETDWEDLGSLIVLKRAAKLVLLALCVGALSGCHLLHKAFPQYDNSGDHGPAAPPPDIYTIQGTTQSDHDLVAIRVVDSAVTVKVNRTSGPEQGWHTCDEFEVHLSTKGTGGGSVRLGYLNLVVGGVSFPVAPKGTQYEITSMKLTGTSSRELY